MEWAILTLRRRSLSCVRTICVLALLLIAVAITLPAVAHADFPLFETDRKTFPATMCRPLVGTSGTIRYELDASVSNDSTTSVLHVVCPFVRDATITDLTENFSVYVVDRNPTQNIKCTVSAHEPFGGIVPNPGPDNVKFSSGSSSGTQKLNLSTLQQASEGYSVLNCGIPPKNPSNGARSRVNVYALEETFANGEASTDSKAYTGVFGEQWVFTLGAQPGFEYEEIGSATRPPGTDLAWWTFPLIRDVVASDWSRVRIRAFDDDGAPNADFLCNVFAYTEDGESDGELSGWCTQDSTLGETTIECIPFLPGGAPTSDDGPYAIHCLSVPQESTVFMYDIREE